jgi:BirA family biotin operon repressor/biotin-[acetyl-CoA-carboxylase] ligase
LLNVLRQLSHADFRSGEEVAGLLSISRASVYNAVLGGVKLGLPIQAIRGYGYRLTRPVTWIDTLHLSSELTSRGFNFHYFESLDSTNAYLMNQMQSGTPHKSLIVAEWQSNGRGRRGRSWLAGLGGGLTYSLSWSFNRTPSELSGLSLVVGLALAQTLRGLGLTSASVKWPNDILVDGDKVAGVLIELAGDLLGPSVAVIGIGINVLGADALREVVDQPVTDLAEQGACIDRNAILLETVLHLDQMLTRFDLDGFETFRADWEALHIYQNHAVQVLTGTGQIIPGQALGVDAAGALLLATDHGIQRFHSGEVSVRGAA